MQRSFCSGVLPSPTFSIIASYRRRNNQSHSLQELTLPLYQIHSLQELNLTLYQTFIVYKS